MKNKKVTILLILILVIIWGVIASKIYHRSSRPLIKKISKQLTLDKMNIVDTYQLHHYIRDPFLSVLTDTITYVEKDTIVKNEKPLININRQIILPQYYGMIQNSLQRIGVLKLNKKIFFVNEKDQLNGMKISTISPDCVIISNNGEKIVIKLDSNKRIWH